MTVTMVRARVNDLTHSWKLVLRPPSGGANRLPSGGAVDDGGDVALLRNLPKVHRDRLLLTRAPTFHCVFSM